MPEDRACVEFTKDSPYILRGVSCISYNGKRIDFKDKNAVLCRCGKSSKQPFCDGSHPESGIEGDKKEDRPAERVVDYRSRDIIVHDNRAVCSHDMSCWKTLPSVFKWKNKIWIRPKNADPERVKKTVRMCPSGALSYTVNNKKIDDFGRSASALIKNEGPLELYGNIKLKDDIASFPEAHEHYALCRCSSSSNKPFCDGGHLKSNSN